MKIEFISEAVAAARIWLAQYWPKKARTVLQEYAAAYEEYPLMFADMAHAGFAFASTRGATPEETLNNTGRRDLWLHIQTMTKLNADDLRSLEQETDQ